MSSTSTTAADETTTTTIKTNMNAAAADAAVSAATNVTASTPTPTTTTTGRAIPYLPKQTLQNNNSGNFLTRSKPFKMIVKKAFRDMDSERNGQVDKNELYMGVLAVHLKLAKFAGPAACYPPTKQVCDSMFEAADTDHSGGIDEQEFAHIVGVLCAQIAFRMAVYYIVLILFVPYLAGKVVDHTGIPNGSLMERAAEQTIGLATFFGAIPFLWNYIDEGARVTIGITAQAEKDHHANNNNTTTTTATTVDKKDD